MASGGPSAAAPFFWLFGVCRAAEGDEEQQPVGVDPIWRSSTGGIAGGFSRLLALWHKGEGSVAFLT